MGIADNFQDKLKKISKQAKDTFDYAKMEIKIKSYGRECKKRYTRMGMLVYECRKKGSAVNGEEIEHICREIDKFKHKIKIIQRQMEEIKEKDCSVLDSDDCSKKEKNKVFLKKKDSNSKDMEKEAKLLKFCPKCDVGNEPDAEVCVKCGHKFE